MPTQCKTRYAHLLEVRLVTQVQTIDPCCWLSAPRCLDAMGGSEDPLLCHQRPGTHMLGEVSVPQGHHPWPAATFSRTVCKLQCKWWHSLEGGNKETYPGLTERTLVPGECSHVRIFVAYCCIFGQTIAYLSRIESRAPVSQAAWRHSIMCEEKVQATGRCLLAREQRDTPFSA